MNVRFAEPCREEPLKFFDPENRIAVDNADIPRCHECVQDIYLGFFFDGTNNNKYRDTLDFAHSNVARLYEAFIGNTAYQTPPTLATNAYNKKRGIFPDARFKPDGFSDDDLKPYRKIYIPGVGTPFPDVSDSGQDKDRAYGLGMAFLGEARLCWALLQVCNQMHAAITGKPVRENVPFKGSKMWYREYLPEKLKSEAENDQAKLEAQLAELEKELDKAVKARGDNKPTLRSLRLSVFGFSRGAAAARAFVNRAVNRWGSTLGGVTLSIDFLGLFDTVASVGIAQSVPGADGHMGWAAGSNLEVPSVVKRCVHLVAAHEVRASFPLDSIGTGDNRKEIVYPGMHSDLGGGYPPNDQGRSLGVGAAGDSLKLSQIPLAQMYREARMAGVPIGAPNQLYAYRMQNFELSPVLRADFNAYIDATRTGSIPATNGKGDAAYARLFPTEQQPRDSLANLIFLHYNYFLQWHKSILGHAHELPGLAENTNTSRWQDVEDIRGADEELQKEVRFLDDKDPKKFERVDDTALEGVVDGLQLAPLISAVHPVTWLVHSAAQAKLMIAEGRLITLSGFAKEKILGAMQEKQRQWDLNLKHVWHGEPLLSGKSAQAAKTLFECYLHDSRAWFKALVSNVRGRGTMNDKATEFKALFGMDGYAMAPNDEDWFTLGGRENEKEAQKATLKARLEQQKKDKDWLGEIKTEEALKALDAQGPLIKGGREPYRLYGYVRERKIYQSGTLDTSTNAKRQKVIEQDENARRKQAEIDAENARHEKVKKTIKDDDDRVIKEHRLSSAEERDYHDSNKHTWKSEQKNHADKLQDIESRWAH